MTHFHVSYESRALIEAEAKRIGWEDGDGSLMDELECNDVRFHVGRSFPTLAAAEAWAVGRVKEGKTFFGCATITEYTIVPRRDRCRHCTCDGDRGERWWEATEDYLSEPQQIDECA